MTSASKNDSPSRARQWLVSSSLVMILCFSYSSLARAQVTYGSATGLVTDSTGAVVPNAKVVLTDVDKGYQYPVNSDATGRYLIINLIAGTYQINVEAPGFKAYIQPGIVVDVGTRVTVDAHLQLGATTQSVNVVGATPLLSTQDSVTGQEITRDMINNLPWSTAMSSI